MSEGTAKNKLENKKKARAKALDHGDVRRRLRLSALAADELANRGVQLKKREEKGGNIGAIILKERRENKAKDAEERDQETGAEPARSCERERERENRRDFRRFSFKNGSTG